MTFEVLLQSRIERIADELVPRASRIVQETAYDVEADAKRLAPVDTGALRNSIMTRMVSPLRAEIAPHVEYAAYQEYGTVHMPAHPYMRPAARRHEAAFQRRLRELVEVG